MLGRTLEQVFPTSGTVTFIAAGGDEIQLTINPQDKRVYGLSEFFNKTRLSVNDTLFITPLGERRYSLEYRAALARTTQFLEQISQAKEQMALAAEDLKLSRIRYEGGEGVAVDVVVAQSQLVQARSGYYTNIANYLSAKLDLEVAAGR